MDNYKVEKIVGYLLCLVGIVIVIDTFLYQFFNIGTNQKNLTLCYCIAFIFSGYSYPKIYKSKYVMIPLYLMIIQLCYSAITNGSLQRVIGIF